MADGSVTFSITADDADAQRKLSKLRRDIEKTSQAIGENTTKKNAIAEQLEVAREEAKKTEEEIQRVRAAAESVSAAKDTTLQIDPDTRGRALAFIEAQEAEEARLTGLLKEQQATITELEGKHKDIADSIAEQTGKLSAMQEEAGAVERTLARTSTSAIPDIRAAIDNVSKSVKKGFRNILKWGFGIRSAYILMRRLRSALKEGIKIFAEYDSETKKNIGDLKNSLQALKVSWGAAFAPIINAITPILQKLISWLATAANYVQMFFNVLAGKNTYKKVIANNEDLAKSYGGAGKAAKDAQKQLMGFDEINKLDDKDSGGGGGGGSDTGIAGVKEEMIPDEAMKKLTWLKDHLDEILIVAGAIGAAMLAWKISKAFLGGFGKFLGIAIAIAGAIMFIREYIDAWNNGIDMGNVIDLFVYLGILVAGLAIAFGKTGAAIGLLVGGIALLVLGFREWIQTGELSWETFLVIAEGILAVGAAIALLTSSWIPLLIAAIVVAVAALVKLVVDNWDKIKETLEKAWNAVKGFFVNIWNHIVEFWHKLGAKLTEIKNGIVNKFNDIKNGIVDKITAVKTKVQEIVDRIKGIFESLHIKLPHIKLPHIVVTWQPAGDLGQFFGINAIPHIGIEWYAKGGIVDGATLIGAGEAGKEAVVPLERNTQWISMVADGLLDALTRDNSLARAISEIPAVANGQIVPPRAISGGGSLLTDGDIQKLVSGLVAALGDNERITKLYLDGRQIAEVVTKQQRQMERGFA